MENTKHKRLVLLSESSKKRASDEEINRATKIPKEMDEVFLKTYFTKVGMNRHQKELETSRLKRDVGGCLDYINNKYSKFLNTKCFDLFYDKRSKSGGEEQKKPSASNVLNSKNTPTISSTNTSFVAVMPVKELKQIISKTGHMMALSSNENILPSHSPDSEIQPAFKSSVQNTHSPHTDTVEMITVQLSSRATNSPGTKPPGPVVESAKCTSAIQKHTASEAQNKTPITFSGRKGNQSLSVKLHKNVGRSYIQFNDLPFLILEWNPDWLITQKESLICPPICDGYTHVKDKYETELEYYNTYFPLHLLSIWLKITSLWNTSPRFVDCVFESQVEKTNFVKVTCYVIFSSFELCKNWLRKEDILLCRISKDDGSSKTLFGRVVNYEYLAVSDDTNDVRVMSRFEFFCVEKLEIRPKVTVRIQVLCNIRVALLQNDALLNLNRTMKDLILNPKNSESRAKFLTLQLQDPREFEDCIMGILYSTTSSNFDITVVETFECDVVPVVTQIALNLLKKDHHVLIGLRNVASLIRFIGRLKNSNIVLAVKSDSTEAQLPKELKKFTLEEKWASMSSSDIFKSGHLILTLISNVFMGNFSEVLTERKLICILPEAHLCTEIDTSLLLYYDVKHLLLMGKFKHGSVSDYVHPILKNFGYDVSLFSRLWKSQ